MKLKDSHVLDLAINYGQHYLLSVWPCQQFPTSSEIINLIRNTIEENLLKY